MKKTIQTIGVSFFVLILMGATCTEPAPIIDMPDTDGLVTNRASVGVLGHTTNMDDDEVLVIFTEEGGVGSVVGLTTPLDGTRVFALLIRPRDNNNLIIGYTRNSSTGEFSEGLSREYLSDRDRTQFFSLDYTNDNPPLSSDFDAIVAELERLFIDSISPSLSAAEANAQAILLIARIQQLVDLTYGVAGFFYQPEDEPLDDLDFEEVRGINVLRSDTDDVSRTHIVEFSDCFTTIGLSTLYGISTPAGGYNVNCDGAAIALNAGDGVDNTSADQGDGVYEAGTTGNGIDQNSSDYIFIGSIIDYFFVAPIAPFDLGDPPDVRFEDAARLIARTVAHELGHSLGLEHSALAPNNCVMNSGETAFDRAGRVLGSLTLRNDSTFELLDRNFLSNWNNTSADGSSLFFAE